jgi:bacillithiol biosynthesis cysteine-adding enzyme BshC
LDFQNQKISLTQISGFNKLFQDYILKNKDLSRFYDNFADLKGFENQISETNFLFRNELVSALNKQYENIANKPNIEIFNDPNTYCVTTGHQLNIFTGPLYVIYKIVSTINLAKKLKNSFPEKNFVPIYWMATEDHDFEEISYFNLFGQKHKWQTDQTGAVGRMNPNELKDILDSLREKPSLFEKAYLENKSLAEAVRYYFNELFGNQGLICVDGDDEQLKKLLIPIIKSDVFENKAEKIVKTTTDDLEKAGYKSQINAREINFFYLKDGIRERIEKVETGYKVINTEIVWTAELLNKEIDCHPERFSPNVVLRPVYQETILPNLAYLGGPSEVCYWLQLKDIFHEYNLPFPIVMPRNFGLIINQATQKKMEKLEMNVEDIFEEEHIMKSKFVKKNSEHTLDFNHENDAFSKIFDEIITKAIKVDPTLKAVVEAEKTKLSNAIINIEKRIKKSEEKNFETGLNQLSALKEKLFPGGGLQERTENFLNYYLNDPLFIDKLLQAFDPLDFNFNVIKI